MSHVVEIQTQVRDPVAIRAACSRLKLQEPDLRCYAKLFSEMKTGWVVRLDKWRYPVVCDVNDRQQSSSITSKIDGVSVRSSISFCRLTLSNAQRSKPERMGIR